MSEDRISRMSLALTLIGAFFFIQGIRIAGIPPANIEYRIAYEAIPIDVRQFLWMFTGSVAMIWSWSKHAQWVAATALVLMPIERIASYLWSFGHYLWSGGSKGSIWSLVDALLWTPILLLVIVIAGWIEWDKTGADSE